MTKLLKYVGTSFGLAFEWVLILFIVCAFAIRTSAFQTFLAQQLAAYLSSELKTSISIDKVDIVFFDRASIEGFTLLDQKNDTLICTPQLMVTINDFDLENNAFELNEIKLNNGVINLVKDKQGAMNYQFLVDYFSSDEPTSSPPLKLSIDKINLEAISFSYNDALKPPLAYGVDFNHLYFKDLSVLLSDFNLKEEVISLQVSKLLCSEKSGFKLNEFTTLINIGPKGISLEKLFISLPESHISAEYFKLNYNSWDSFDYFEDSVIFDASFQASDISLKDVSFWVPSIEGMDDHIQLKCDIKENLAHLKISNLDARILDQTFIRGDFTLPDFRTNNLASFSSKISSSYFDFQELGKIKLPKDFEKIDFSVVRDAIGFIELKEIECSGNKQVIFFKAKQLNCLNGSLSLTNGVQIQNSSSGISIQPIKQNDPNALEFFAVNLAKLTGDQQFGLINGKLGFETFRLSKDDAFQLDKLSAKISSLDYQGYPYRNITVEAPSINNAEFAGGISVADPNLLMNLSGKARYSGEQRYNLTLDLSHAHLSKLGFVTDDSLQLSTKLTIDLNGKNLNNVNGSISSEISTIVQGSKSIKVPRFDLTVKRENGKEDFKLSSEVVNASIQGKIDYNSVFEQFTEDASVVFPSLFLTKAKAKRKKQSDFTFEVNVGETDELFALFVPALKISKNTKLKGSYQSAKKEINVLLTADSIAYDNLSFEGLKLDQSISSQGINGSCQVKKFDYDSISFDKLSFTNLGKNGLLESRLTWNLKGKDNSELAWTTMVIDQNDLRFTIKPSFFSLENYRWEITDETQLALGSKNLNLDTLSLKRNKQSIKVFGCISDNDYDKLKVEIDNLELKEITELLQSESTVEGTFSGLTTISNPYKNLTIESDAIIDSLYLEGEEVGKVFLSPKWIASQDKVDLSGALIYKGMKTFNFGGNYALNSEKLNLYLNFDKTDIRFANAFLDPELVSDINGKLNGIVYVTGSVSEPQLAGRLNLSNGSALIGLTGVRYKLNGAIGVKKDVFEINHIPVYDEEGNEARLTATINHTNFEKFNYEVQFDFENGLKGKNNYNRFMVLNTQYKDGESYFGKAYGRGTLNIEGLEDKVDITVNVETRKGTSINFPMYGAEEFEEDEDFITFLKKGKVKETEEELNFYSGVNVDMNFIVNTDAEMKLIFDNNTGDQIEAKGFGELNMKIDPFYNVSLTGKYEISEGSKYNFAMGSFKQPFDIVPGSTLKWNGDLLDAELNIGTSITMKRVSLLELSPELTDKSLASQDVVCYLNLKDKLLQPAITFDIEAPKAPETGKALVRKVTEDKDELNKQFFSLLLVKKFQPLKGSVNASGSAAIDMLETQMNEILGKMSEKYKLNLDYGKDETLNETSIGFGMKTQFFKDRLEVSGTFGVGGISSEDGANSTTNNFIGDVNIEYLINETGTFRINAFNESSNNSTNANSANNATGMYTQGVGVSYHEDFHKWIDFMLLQYTLDLFRKDKKYWKKKEEKPSRKTPVTPTKSKQKDIIQDKKNSI